MLLRTKQFTSEIQLVSLEDLTYPGLARVARIQGLVVIKAKLDDRAMLSMPQLFRTKSG